MENIMFTKVILARWTFRATYSMDAQLVSVSAVFPVAVLSRQIAMTLGRATPQSCLCTICTFLPHNHGKNKSHRAVHPNII